MDSVVTQQFQTGQTVFVPSDEQGYEAMSIVESKGFGANAQIKAAPLGSGSSSARTLDAQEKAGIVDSDPLALSGAPDMVKLTKLSAPALLHNLRVRYSRDEIYTRVGAILISVNPFKQLTIYTPEKMREAKDADAKALQDLDPHVYALAEGAFRGMLIEQKQQSLLISGESGAGKTEAVKACLRYIVARSSDAAKGHGSSTGDRSGVERAKYIEDCIMQANPLLEALGNAKTLRNGNSSRFGKWIEVQFDASGFITSSRITSYLLEKSRVTEHAEGERTYHSLYQLCRGCTGAQRSALKLVDPKAFRYIGASAGVVVPDVDDAKWWVATCHAMDVFGLSADDQQAMRQVLAAVLHLGNLAFEVVQMAQQDDGCKVDAASKGPLDTAAELTGLGGAALEQALTVKSVGKFPVVQVPQPPPKAAATRDALAKSLYGQVFEWTISRINETMGTGAGPADAKRTIGMLDIFGFEAFKRNSLEQLLINFANEKLQAHFNEYIFKLEEAECNAEGVACPKLEFADNSNVMELMTARPAGVLSLINEEVIVPNSSDNGLLQKLQQQHRAQPTFKPMPRAQGEGFVIHHYAGPVGYLIEGFVDKNRDTLPGELVQLLATSKMPLMEAIYKPGGAADAEPPKSARGGGGARGRTGGGGRKVKALASQFVDSLDALMSVLQRTTPHFVRCVKPNALLQPNNLDGSYVMRQLTEMGMVHVVRARKQGFAHRYAFELFLARYGYLLRNRTVNEAACQPFYAQHMGTNAPPPGERLDCTRLLAVMAIEGVLANDGWAVGTGKVFLKEAQQQQLEVERETYLLKVVTEQLQAAIAKRDVPSLESAIAAAIEVNLQSALLKDAQQLLALLQAQLRAAAKLAAAIEAREINLLDAALIEASNVGLVNEHVQQAQQLVSQLRQQQEATAALTSALSRNDVRAIEGALAAAERCGLNSSLMRDAQRRLDTLRRTAELEQALDRATQSDDLTSLAQLIAQADEISLDTPPLQRAKARRGVLQEVMQLIASLESAQQARDATGLRTIIERSRAAAVQTAELANARAAAEAAVGEIEASAAQAAQQQAQQQAAAEAQRQAEAQAQARAQQQAAAAAQSQAEEATWQQERSEAESFMRSASFSPPGSAQLLQAQVQRRSVGSEPLNDVNWIPCNEGDRSLPCQPLTQRVQALQSGSSLIKVAEGSFARHRYAPRFVMLSFDGRHLTWDDGKKSVELSHVTRVSIGLETRTLQRLYSGNAIPTDVSSFHWFSLHTSSRSFDFGATKESGPDENEAIVLWVLTLQHLLASRQVPEIGQGACCALSNAQFQWQRFDNSSKEWPCLMCTFHNPPNRSRCQMCSSERPMVTICPCLTPLVFPLKALANTLGLKVFQPNHPESHLLWFLVQALEAPLPSPFRWQARSKSSDPSEPFLLMSTDAGTRFETVNHPHIEELKRHADSLRAQLNANGGRPDFNAQSMTPRVFDALESPGGSAGSARDSHRDDGYGTPLAGLSQREFEMALASAADGGGGGGGSAMPHVQQAQSFGPEEGASYDAADVFRHCMSGSVNEVRRFLELGGHADTVYKVDYGWDVGPDWLFTKPNDGTTVLNYVSTWTDIIGDAAVDIARLLLQYGADLQRDDAQELWFTPLHNAVANGAFALVEAILDHQPEAIHFTTGDGRSPLHVLSLCDDPNDRVATLSVLLRRRTTRNGDRCEPRLEFQEPFYGNTALHAAAKEGHSEVVVNMLEAGMPQWTSNEAGRNALQEAQHELMVLESEGQASTAMRRARLSNTISVMEIAYVAT